MINIWLCRNCCAKEKNSMIFLELFLQEWLWYLCCCYIEFFRYFFWSSQFFFWKFGLWRYLEQLTFVSTFLTLKLLYVHHNTIAFHSEQNNLFLTFSGGRMLYCCLGRKWERKLFHVSFLDCSVILCLFSFTPIWIWKLCSCRFCQESGKDMNIWRLSRIVTSILKKSGALTGNITSMSKILVLGP